MRCVRLYRRWLLNSCWNSDMKRIIARILKALRSVLSRFRSAPAASPRPEIHQTDGRQPEEQQPSSGGVCEASSAEVPTGNICKTDESAEVVLNHCVEDVRGARQDNS